MNAFLLSVVLLGQADPWLDNWQDRQQRKRDSAAQRQTEHQVARSYQQEDRTNTYIIAGAIVAGLLLFGLLARGKK